MPLGNVLVIGNSGVGKSTLINAVLGEEAAATGGGIEGVTSELKIYENEKINFRIIDTIGFEPDLLKRTRAINAVKKWSKDSAKNNDEDRQVNVIWYCVDGTTKKIFPETIKYLSKATRMWKSVPVIVVVTKSYSKLEHKENIDTVYNAFSRQKYEKNLKGVIPVVAAPYKIEESYTVQENGIEQLIELTWELLPEGKKATEIDVNRFVLNRKRAFSQAAIGSATIAATIVGAVPIPFSDAALLTPTELALVKGIAQIYGIKKDEKGKQTIQQIVELGTVGVVAKTVISGLKAIPGINLAASVLNAAIAGSLVAAIGEATVYIFEQIYLGNKSMDDIDWITKAIESKLAGTLMDKAGIILQKIADQTDNKQIAEMIFEVLKKTD